MSIFTDFLDALNGGVLPKRDITPATGNEFADMLIDRIVAKTFQGIPGLDVLLWMAEHSPPVKGLSIQAQSMPVDTSVENREGDRRSGSYTFSFHRWIPDRFQPGGGYFIWGYDDYRWHWAPEGSAYPGGYWSRYSESHSSINGLGRQDITQITIDPFNCGPCNNRGAILRIFGAQLGMPSQYRSARWSWGKSQFPSAANSDWVVATDNTLRPTLPSNHPFSTSYFPLVDTCGPGECPTVGLSPPRPHPRLLRAIEIGGLRYLTALSDTDEPEKFLAILKKAPLIAIPMNSYAAEFPRREGEVRTLFGDVEPPVWYSRLISPVP